MPVKRVAANGPAVHLDNVPGGEGGGHLLMQLLAHITDIQKKGSSVKYKHYFIYFFTIMERRSLSIGHTVTVLISCCIKYGENLIRMILNQIGLKGTVAPDFLGHFIEFTGLDLKRNDNRLLHIFRAPTIFYTNFSFLKHFMIEH